MYNTESWKSAINDHTGYFRRGKNACKSQGCLNSTLKGYELHYGQPSRRTEIACRGWPRVRWAISCPGITRLFNRQSEGRARRAESDPIEERPLEINQFHGRCVFLVKDSAITGYTRKIANRRGEYRHRRAFFAMADHARLATKSDKFYLRITNNAYWNKRTQARKWTGSKMKSASLFLFENSNIIRRTRATCKRR